MVGGALSLSPPAGREAGVRGISGRDLRQEAAEAGAALAAAEPLQYRPERRLVGRHDRFLELALPLADRAIVGKLPPGTTNASISGRSMRAKASRAFSGPSWPIA